MKKIIWQDNNLNVEDYRDYFEELEQEKNRILTDDEKTEEMYNLNNEYYDDEKINLNKILDGNIICIANLGLWNGKKSGYKILSDNLNNIFDVCEDYNEFFIDNYDVKAKCTHHDGTNYYTFREIKQDVNIDILTDKIYNGNFTQKDITRYTKSLKPYLKKIYGW